MKDTLYPLCLLVCTSLLASETSVELGQTKEVVLAILGKPMGTIGLRDKTLLLYPQGEIIIKESRVSHIDLMKAEEFAADQERLKKEREEWLVAQERIEAAHIEEGRLMRADKLQSQAFAALPAKDRVDYWRSFQIRYPSIDVADQIGSALASYQVELDELRSQQKIADLKARVANAEREAAAARLETEKLRVENERTKQRSRFYGLHHYTDTVVDRRYYYRPPTVTIFTSGGNTATHRSNNYCPPTKSVPKSATHILNVVQ